jgi:hypothetical protein
LAKIISVEDATHSLKLLREGLADLETRLLQNGFDEAEAGYWIFHTVEILDDWQEMQEKLATICNANDFSQIPQLLNDFAKEMLYSVTPHIQGHMEQLETMLEKRFPENLDSDFE